MLRLFQSFYHFNLPCPILRASFSFVFEVADGGVGDVDARKLLGRDKVLGEIDFQNKVVSVSVLDDVDSHELKMHSLSGCNRDLIQFTVGLNKFFCWL